MPLQNNEAIHVIFRTMKYVHIIKIYNSSILILISHGIGTRRYKRDRLWVPFPHENMKYFVFSSLRSGVKVKNGVEFRREFGGKWRTVVS